MHLRTQFLEHLGIGIGTRKANNLMAVCDQLLGRGGADKSGRAGDEYTHVTLLC
jgi:hypothetical protein